MLPDLTWSIIVLQIEGWIMVPVGPTPYPGLALSFTPDDDFSIS